MHIQLGKVVLTRFTRGRQDDGREADKSLQYPHDGGDYGDPVGNKPRDRKTERDYPHPVCFHDGENGIRKTYRGRKGKKNTLSGIR